VYVRLKVHVSVDKLCNWNE